MFELCPTDVDEKDDEVVLIQMDDFKTILAKEAVTTSSQTHGGASTLSPHRIENLPSSGQESKGKPLSRRSSLDSIGSVAVAWQSVETDTDLDISCKSDRDNHAHMSKKPRLIVETPPELSRCERVIDVTEKKEGECMLKCSGVNGELLIEKGSSRMGIHGHDTYLDFLDDEQNHVRAVEPAAPHHKERALSKELQRLDSPLQQPSSVQPAARPKIGEAKISAKISAQVAIAKAYVESIGCRVAADGAAMTKPAEVLRHIARYKIFDLKFIVLFNIRRMDQVIAQKASLAQISPYRVPLCPRHPGAREQRCMHFIKRVPYEPGKTSRSPAGPAADRIAESHPAAGRPERAGRHRFSLPACDK